MELCSPGNTYIKPCGLGQKYLIAWNFLCIENRPLGQELALFRSWRVSAESIEKDPVSPPLCSNINSSDQEPPLWHFSLTHIPESLSCNPLHSTRKKRGVSALLEHTRTTDLALLEPFHTLQVTPMVSDRPGTRKAYTTIPEHQSLPGICGWVTHARADVLVSFCWAAPGGEGHKSCLGTHRHQSNCSAGVEKPNLAPSHGLMSVPNMMV